MGNSLCTPLLIQHHIPTPRAPNRLFAPPQDFGIAAAAVVPDGLGFVGGWRAGGRWGRGRRARARGWWSVCGGGGARGVGVVGVPARVGGVGGGGDCRHFFFFFFILEFFFFFLPFKARWWLR